MVCESKNDEICEMGILRRVLFVGRALGLGFVRCSVKNNMSSLAHFGHPELLGRYGNDGTDLFCGERGQLE